MSSCAHEVGVDDSAATHIRDQRASCPVLNATHPISPIGATFDKILIMNVPFILHRLVRDLDRAGDRMLRAELDLSYSRALVLLALDVEGSMSQHELASWVGSTSPAVTGLLRELTASGYVWVVNDRENRRKNVVDLTAKGREVAQRARSLLDHRFGALLRESQVDGDRLAADLARLNGLLRKSAR